MDKKLQEKKFYIDNAEKIVVKLSNETLNETPPRGNSVVLGMHSQKETP
mgnify:CR=1 FL=1